MQTYDPIINNTYKCSWCDTTYPDPYYVSLDDIKRSIEKETLWMKIRSMEDYKWYLTAVDPDSKDQVCLEFYPESYESETGRYDIRIIGSACQFKDTNKPRLAQREGFFSYEKVIFNPPATIVIWNDGSKTVVKCGPNDYYDPEKGLALCFMKRAFSNDNNKFHKVFNKALKDGSMTGYPPFPMTPVEFDEFYEEYLKLKEEKNVDADANRESTK